MKRSFFYVLIIFLSACHPVQDHKQEAILEPIDSLVENLPEDTFYNDDIYEDSFYEEEKEFVPIDSALTGLNFTKGSNYLATKAKMKRLRTLLYEDYLLIEDSLEKESFLDSAMCLFVDKLLNEIVPYWYGTVWDFEGHTAKPNDGLIACGYFVSTTLRDMGLSINRYKMAQQAGLNEAKTLALSNEENLLFFEYVDFEEVSKYLNSLKDGLYFVGLDCHVGYLYKKGNQNYFIHSNYIDGFVMIEDCNNSEAFNSSVYCLAKISTNKELTLMWLQNKEVQIVR